MALCPCRRLPEFGGIDSSNYEFELIKPSVHKSQSSTLICVADPASCRAADMEMSWCTALLRLPTFLKTEFIFSFVLYSSICCWRYWTIPFCTIRKDNLCFKLRAHFHEFEHLAGQKFHWTLYCWLPCLQAYLNQTLKLLLIAISTSISLGCSVSRPGSSSKPLTASVCEICHQHIPSYQLLQKCKSQHFC